jgi:hypothetical protein
MSPTTITLGIKLCPLRTSFQWLLTSRAIKDYRKRIEQAEADD